MILATLELSWRWTTTGTIKADRFLYHTPKAGVDK